MFIYFIHQIPNQVGNDTRLKFNATNCLINRHPQLDWGSHVFNVIRKIPSQVGNDACVEKTYLFSSSYRT
jgi:hypothetical protein